MNNKKIDNLIDKAQKFLLNKLKNSTDEFSNYVYLEYTLGNAREYCIRCIKRVSNRELDTSVENLCWDFIVNMSWVLCADALEYKGIELNDNDFFYFRIAIVEYLGGIILDEKLDPERHEDINNKYIKKYFL